MNVRMPTAINVSEVRIERDPATGAILRVIDDGKRAKPNPLNDPLNALDDDQSDDDDGDDGEEWQGIITEHDISTHGPNTRPSTAKTDVVRRLEEQAAQPVVKRVRKQSEREEEWISDLIAKHGDDYHAMSWDAKLNPMQQSVGDIKRRVNKFKARRQT